MEKLNKIKKFIKKKYRKYKYLDKIKSKIFIIPLIVSIFTLYIGGTYAYFHLNLHSNSTTITLANFKYQLTSLNNNFSNNSITVPANQSLELQLNLKSLNQENTKYALDYMCDNSNVQVMFIDQREQNVLGEIGKLNSIIDINIVIENDSESDQTVSFNLKGGYLQNTLSSNIKEQWINSDARRIDKKMVVQDINYQDSLVTIRNPDRGWYRPITIDLVDVATYNMQLQCLEAINQNISIIHLRIDIGQLSGNVNSDNIDKDFTEEHLQSLNSLLDTIRKNTLSVIIRFSYSFNGDTGKEPKSFTTIKNHINQLSPFFNTNKDIISTVEAGFLGPWGEMHTAGQYQQDNYYKELIETLLENTPTEMTVNVRKPYFYKLVVGKLDNSQHRIGIFNDGYLASSTDLGTFDNGINRNSFINWMQVQGEYTLYGGETTQSEDVEDAKYNDSSFAINEMPRTHTAYLNSLFNLNVIEKWQNQSYSAPNTEYDGQTAYKYISDHLGYRLILRNSKISSSVKKGDICGVKLEIENVGFGNIIRNQKTSVILRRGYDYYEAPLDINPNDIKSNEIKNVKFYFYIPSDIEAGDWEVYLKIANERNSDYAIQFANPDMWKNELLSNHVGKITIEDLVVEEEIKIKQAFVSNATVGDKAEVPKPKIPITMNFHIENGETYYAVESYNIELGTLIDFTNPTVLSNLGITIPAGYKFSYAQCYAITNDWEAHNSIRIPDNPTESSYAFNVFITP